MNSRITLLVAYILFMLLMVVIVYFGLAMVALPPRVA